MADDAFQVVMNEEARRFELSRGGEVAFAEYGLRDGDMLLPHTVVPESMAGQAWAAPWPRRRSAMRGRTD